MAAIYATMTDVKARLALYVPDIDGLIITPEAQAASLTSASEAVRIYSRVAYTDAILASYAPTYPPALVDLTAIIAAQQLIRHVGSISDVASSAMVRALDADMARLVNVVRTGSLVDADGDPVPSMGASIVVRAYPELHSDLEEVYEHGYRDGFR